MLGKRDFEILSASIECLAHLISSSTTLKYRRGYAPFQVVFGEMKVSDREPLCEEAAKGRGGQIFAKELAQSLHKELKKCAKRTIVRQYASSILDSFQLS